MFIAFIVLFSIIAAILLGLGAWRLALMSKASKEAKDANQPAPEMTWQDFVNGMVLLIGLILAAIGIKVFWDKRRDAKEAAGNGRR